METDLASSDIRHVCGSLFYPLANIAVIAGGGGGRTGISTQGLALACQVLYHVTISLFYFSTTLF
jgi:hypothetical protein